MRIDELSADEFMAAVSDIAAAAAEIAASESGKALFNAFAGFQGALSGVPEEERETKATDFLVKTILGGIPALLKENGNAVYSLLAACDGQTAEEYKAAFTVPKLMADVKALCAWFAANAKEGAGFLAQ